MATREGDTIDMQNPSIGDIEKQRDKVDDRESIHTSEATSSDGEVVDFAGPDDPYDPHNWKSSKKWMHAGLLAYMSFVVPTASTMFAPGVPEAMREFHATNETLGSFVVSIYLLGNGFGPLFIAPLSELYGRNPIYHVTNVLFIVFNVACAVAPSFASLIVFRLLAGVAGSAAITVGSGSIADMFHVHERGAATAVWALGPLLVLLPWDWIARPSIPEAHDRLVNICLLKGIAASRVTDTDTQASQGPVVGPIAGSYLASAEGWRWVFWLMSILGGVGTLATLILLRETYAPILLERKAKGLRKESAKPFRSKLATTRHPRDHLLTSLIRPFRMLFLSPIVFLLSLYMSIIYGYIYLLFTTMTAVFRGTYGFSASNVGLAYIGIGIGTMSGMFFFGKFSDKLVRSLADKTNNGIMEPEFRLPLMIPGAPVVAAGLFIYGWTSQYKVHWVVPEIGTSFVGFGLLVTFMPTLNYLVDAYTRYAASAIAANTVLRSVMGAVLPLAGPKMYEALNLGWWGNSLLAFLTLATAPIPWFFYKYGKGIRMKASAVEW